MTAVTPSSASSATSRRSEVRVCCTTPGSDAIGTGASMPSRTNSGATRSSTPSRVSATRRRSAGVRRRRRSRWAGKLTAGSYDSGSAGQEASSTPGERLDERVEGVGVGLGADLEAEPARLGGGDRPDGDDDRRHGVGADAVDQVAHRRGRGEGHRVRVGELGEGAVVVAHRDGPVGLDHVDLPAHRREPVGQHVAGHRGTRQQHPSGPGRAGRREHLEQGLGDVALGQQVDRR